MVDVLIRDVPEHVVAAIDAAANRLGVSRNEYLRRWLVREVATSGDAVTLEDLSRFADTFSDLAAPEVIRQAWR